MRSDASNGAFPAGVMAGDAEPDSVVLWTKHRGAAKLEVRLWPICRDAQQNPWQEPVNKPTIKFPPRPEEDKLNPKSKFFHVEVSGLKSGTEYEYQFFEHHGSGRTVPSPIGHFRTAIEYSPNQAQLEPVTFGGTSCTSQVMPHVRNTNRNLKAACQKRDELNISFFVHAGDQLYCDARTEPPPVDIADYQDRYEKAFSDNSGPKSRSSPKGLNALHRAFGIYTTWDDHEVIDDWQGKQKFPRKIKNIAEKRAINIESANRSITNAGKRSFFQHQPIRNKQENNNHQTYTHRPSCKCLTGGNQSPARSRDNKKIWGSFRWGNTLELFILDCRSERRVIRRSDNNKITKGRYISRKQMKWLINGLHNSPAVFKFILNSSPIGIFPNLRQGKLLKTVLNQGKSLQRALKQKKPAPQYLKRIIRHLMVPIKKKKEFLLKKKLLPKRERQLLHLLGIEHRRLRKQLKQQLSSQDMKLLQQQAKLLRKQTSLLRKQARTPEKSAKGGDYRWDAPWLRRQRERILSAAQCVGGVCWLSGDLHYGSVGGLGLDSGQYPNVCEVLMGPGGQSIRDRKRRRHIRSFEKLWSNHWNFSTPEDNYVIIRAVPDLLNRDNSTLEIRFFRRHRQLYGEKRRYNMKFKEELPPL
ncbi:alkaline phosphatase D family protein [Sorangium sp. So ce296]|uniref:alkaline phosphatase D family protein n=1 Tax=Sorangium sp. So ce296 TaxID=3133296 RepID=UPI003F5DE9BA